MKPDFDKYINGLVPVIVQDDASSKVLMLGYMNEEAYNKTLDEGKVVFFSRSKQRLWMKGETSGNFLSVHSILNDCDNDCLLIKVIPAGSVCHTGSDTCFGESNSSISFISQLENIITQRINNPDEKSYISKLFAKGINKITQKVGEEAVELVIEAKDDNITLFKDEAADLLFHYLILLNAKGVRLSDIESILKDRHKNKAK